MTAPVCRLIKALYGHPEAGGHWERHLAAIVVQLGGELIRDHPSCFWFADQRLMLTIYVDDLLLSGPEELHDAFWGRLGEHVTIEKPENLERFLGRQHTRLECERLDINLFNYFASPLEA